MKLKFFLLAVFLGLLGLPGRAVAAVTATLSAGSNYLLPQGGTATLTVRVSDYSATTSSLGVNLTLPAGWAYLGGTGEAETKPENGDTGLLGWAYTIVPPDGANFSFEVSYPASAGTPSLTAAVIVRNNGVRADVNSNALSFLQATLPVVTNVDPAAGTYDTRLSFNIAATSPIPISSYGATGLPDGLALDPLSGVVSGKPAVTGGPFTITLMATNAVGTGTKDVSLTINQATGIVTLTQLVQVYNGMPKPVTVKTTPSNLQVSVLYASTFTAATNGGTSTAPTNAGTYAVSASITDPNYVGSTEGLLAINKAPQSIVFTIPGSLRPGDSITLTAKASSGLPVTFSLVGNNGNATLNGSTLKLVGAGDIVVRATQAGDDNYLPASSDQTINAQKLEQTITFPQPPDKLATDVPFDLSATASSGLPVTFTIITGPAQLAGNTVTLTGVAGQVIVRASQAGNDLYLPAVSVTRTFTVTAVNDRTFFGRGYHGTTSTPHGIGLREVAATGEVAAVLPAGSNAGSLLIVAPEVGISELIGFIVKDDGTFDLVATQTTETGKRTVSGAGQLLGGTLSGVFDSIGFSFSMALDSEDGASAGMQGLYVSTALGVNSGATYTIIGSNNEVLVLVVTPTTTVGGLTTLQGNGTFAVQSDNVAISGALDALATSVSTVLAITGDQGVTTIGFGGLKSSTHRTDRLMNLSGRAHVGAGENVLISGFVIGGSAAKPVLIRAVGPALGPLGVTNPLATPQIRIVRGDGQTVAQNKGWSNTADPGAIAAAAARVGAFPLAPGSADSAFLTTLSPGVYTAIVSGGDGTALAEIYDASENPAADYQRLINISARGYVGFGGDVLIGGLVIGGNAPKRVLLRAIGPTLATQGLTMSLTDPVLKVFKGSTVIGMNDNWDTDQAAAEAIAVAVTKTGAFALPSGSKDAAIILTLAPGVYTMHVSPASGTVPGIALAEIYEIPE